MKYIFSLLALLVLASTLQAEEQILTPEQQLRTAAAGEQVLTREQQLRIVHDLLYATGRRSHPHYRTALAAQDHGYGDVPIKCGMSAVADFMINKNNLDSDIRASLGINELYPRVQLPEAYDSPQGRFKIHYAKSGVNVVFRANEDADGDGVPNFVEAVAIIADSVWHNIITVLGYPAPPSDSFYTETGTVPDANNPPAGGDGKFDIYLLDLGSAYYGLSYLDSISIDGPGGLRATSFMELDHDYQALPGYESRPLDAVRVTMAHEFFHAVQFGIDYTEAEPSENPDMTRRYFMELSAVWMEEHLYDDINDYYGYLPFFFVDPTRSLQQFSSFIDLHPYASGLFGVFLDEKFGPDVMRETWLRCGAYGRGPHFLQALDVSLDSMTDGSEDIASAMAAFAIWNYFTGERSHLAPTGTGYREAEVYPMIPDSAMIEYTRYADTVGSAESLAPQHMAATYFTIGEGLAIEDRVWVQGREVPINTLCSLVFIDSTFSNSTFRTPVEIELVDAVCADIAHTLDTCAFGSGCIGSRLAMYDSTFDVYMNFDSLNRPWWVTSAYRLHDKPDSHQIDVNPVYAPLGGAALFQTLEPERFCSQTMIVSAASTNFLRYRPTARMGLTYLFQEIKDSINQSPCGFDSTVISLPAAIIFAYPNPARVSEMGEELVKFRYQIPTTELSFPACDKPVVVIDLFSLAGERVATMSDTLDLMANTNQGPSWNLGNHDVLHELTWNMRNASGKPVASGVYVGFMRLYCDASRSEMLAESTVKVAIIR